MIIVIITLVKNIYDKHKKYPPHWFCPVKRVHITL